MHDFEQVRLSTSLEEMRTFVEGYIHPALLVNTDGRIIHCNKAFVHSFDMECSESDGDWTSGRPLSSVGILESVQELHRMYQTVSLCEDRPTLSVSFPKRDAVQLPYSIMRLSGSPGEGAVYMLQLHSPLNSEITLLKRFADTFMKDLNLGVIIMDKEFKLIEISDMACDVLGLDRNRVLRKTMEEVFVSVPAEYRLVERTILDGAVVRNHAVSWTNNHERSELLLDSHLLKNDSGLTIGAYLIFKDVTNLRSLEEQVKRSDRLAMIGQIAAGAAHEIRNPLTSIKGFLQVLRTTFTNNGMLKEQGYTDIMLTEINRITDLVSEFLMLSKQKNVSLYEVGISSVLHDILPIIHSEAILHKVDVQYKPAPEMPFVVADREWLKQVFLNICKNGIEAMPEGGTLTISESVDAGEEKVSVIIHDTGPGIPGFVIDKIFDPFFTTKEDGTGLGLSVCQRIIHDLGGQIRVSSKGYGTHFIVSLPLSGK